MNIFYKLAVIGTAVTIVVGLLQLTGLLDLDHDGDFHFDHDHGFAFLNIFSIKNVAYFATLGGWSAVWARSLDFSPIVQVIFFATGGVIAVGLNLTLMYFMKKLNHKPVETPESFVGAPAICTVTIQPHSAGLVHVTVNGRLSEYVAKSDELINPGENCIVKNFSNNQVEVYRSKGA